MSEVAAVVLAAGAASRFRDGDATAASKLVAELDGKALIRHVAEAALASRATPVIAITGHERGIVEAALAGLPVHCIFNPDYESGLASSLKVGLAAVPPGAAGAVILLGDMPAVSAALIDRLIETLHNTPQASAIVPTYGGKRGNPVVLARTLFPAVGALTGDEGARRILQNDPKVLELPVSDPAVTVDIDTRQALDALRRRRSSAGQ